MNKKTLVIGTSTNPERYSYLAVNKLLKHKHSVLAIGLKNGTITSVTIETTLLPYENIDTVTLYVNPANQKQYYSYIISLQPKRIIFNPGTENPELEKMAEDKGIETIEACTLVMLSVGNY